MSEPTDSDAIQAAAEAIRAGELVVIPTETVYGLAADATNADAVRRIFAAKGRPADNPCIVHVASKEQAKQVAEVWPESAECLAATFWPGPLTIVLPKADHIPTVTTGGKPTVAVRMPDHPLALAVLAACGVPLAIPSANRFTELSPTRVEHVPQAIREAAAIVLDGGPCRVGLESTVVDLTADPARILRPGGIGRFAIEGVLGAAVEIGGTERRAPGMYEKHYAPAAKLVLVDRLPNGLPGLALESAGEGQIAMPQDPVAYAAQLYDALHRLDQTGVEAIFVERPPATPEWEAVHDRLAKAASGG